MFTFVIPAHNEQESIATIVAQARRAAQPGDRVLVVDSASTDGTARRAAAAGADVLPGPLGKGAAMAAGIAAAAGSEWVCFLDADLFTARVNVAAVLRAAAAGGTADHVLGDYEYADPGTILSSTFTIYGPLVAELFPEVGDLGANALTGYRAVRRRFMDQALHGGRLPADFGIEAYLNISIAVAGGGASVCHLGEIGSRFRHKPGMPREIGRSVLDLAVSHGRIDPATRDRWERWVEEMAAVIAGITDSRTGRSAALSRLFAGVRRPLPSRVRHPRGRPLVAPEPERERERLRADHPAAGDPLRSVRSGHDAAGRRRRRTTPRDGSPAAP